MISARVTLAGVLCVLACGDRPSAADTAPNAVRRDTATTSRDPAAMGDSLIAVPALLAGACLVGDPDEGIRWTLDSAELTGVAIEGIEMLVPRDSARLVARIARMADVIPTDTNVADFRGLPVTVRAAWRLAPAEGDTIVVALVARRMPIESAPLEELFTIIASPGQRPGVRDPLVEGWFVREVGAEEALVTRELAGAYRRDADAIVLAFAEDAEGGVRVALLERRAGRWQTGWSGPVPSCSVR